MAIVSDYDNMYFGLEVNGRLDREQVDSFELTVRLSDSGQVSMSSELLLGVLLVDINDNRPVADAARVRVSLGENQSGQKLVQLNVKDADWQPEITYEIVVAGAASNGSFESERLVQ